MDAHAKGLRIGETRIHCRYDVDGSTLGSFTHGSTVLNELLTLVGIRRPLLLLGVPGTLVLLAGVACGLWAVRIYQTTTIFAIGWVLLAMLLVNLGVLGMFAALVFNLLPRSSAEAVRKAMAMYQSH